MDYEPIDKIINAVLKERLDTATIYKMELLRAVAVAALEHGYAAGYENGFDDGNNIGYCVVRESNHEN
jgi:hypothetical protein